MREFLKIFDIFAETTNAMFENFSKEQKRNADNDAAKECLSNKDLYATDALLHQLYENKLAETEIFVVHQKDSYAKYGDGDEYEGYSSWIDFWKKNCDYNKELELIKKCPCCGGPMTDPDGAHVKEEDKSKIYITPTCSSCNPRAAQKESLRRKGFSVKAKYLVPFNYDELKKLRHPKQK